MACCSSSGKYGRIFGGLWCVLQRRDLSSALTADRLHRNATPRERESDPRTVAAAARKQLHITVNLPSALSGATPEKAHRMQQSGPGSAAFVTPPPPLTECIATACPVESSSPRPFTW